MIDDFERKNKVLVDKYVPIGYLELPHKIPNIISVSAKNKKRFALENVLKDETQLKKEKNKNKAKTNKNDVKESIIVAEWSINHKIIIFLVLFKLK